MKKIIWAVLIVFMLVSVVSAATIKLRRDSAADWTSANPTLAEGEVGIETDTDKMKVGDGSTVWSSLSYMFQTASIADDSLTEAKLDVTNSPTDNYVLSYDSASSGFTWVVYSAAPAVATSAEINTGTDNAKFISPDALAGSFAGSKEAAWTIVDSDTDTAVADGKQAFIVPSSMVGYNLVDVTASVHDLNSAASGTTTVVIRRVRGATAVDMTSTGVTIAYGAYTASDETVNTSNDDLALGDKLYVDVNAITTAVQKGLSVTCVFRRP